MNIIIPNIKSTENCRYLRNEIYNNVRCVVLEFTSIQTEREMQADGSIQKISYSHRIWMDIEDGFILKKEIYKLDRLNRVITYHVQVNCVTEKDINLPNLKDYELMNS